MLLPQTVPELSEHPAEPATAWNSRILFALKTAIAGLAYTIESPPLAIFT